MNKEQKALTFLVVDDDDGARQILVEYLKSYGYQQIVEAKTGVEALRDGWRLFQASQILPHERGAEFDVSYLKYEFWFEQLVEVSA